MNGHKISNPLYGGIHYIRLFLFPSPAAGAAGADIFKIIIKEETFIMASNAEIRLDRMLCFVGLLKGGFDF